MLLLCLAALPGLHHMLTHPLSWLLGFFGHIFYPSTAQIAFVRTCGQCCNRDTTVSMIFALKSGRGDMTVTLLLCE